MDTNKILAATSILFCVSLANAQSSTTTTTVPTETRTTEVSTEPSDSSDAAVSTPRESTTTTVPVERTTTTTAPASTTTSTDTTTVVETSDKTAERPDKPGGFFFEPLLTYTDADADLVTSDITGFGGDTSANTDGAGLGIRLGSHVKETFLIGVDGRYSRLEISDSAYGTADGDNFNVGPFVGLQMPTFLGLRIWGTYVMAGQYDPESGASGLNVRFEEPKGWRYGAGIKIGDVSLNLEYQDINFDDTKIQSFGTLPGTATSSADLDIEGYTASLSFPMEF